MHIPPTWRLWTGYVLLYMYDKIIKIKNHPKLQLVLLHVTNVFLFIGRWIHTCLGNRKTSFPPNIIIAVCGKKGSGKDTTTAKLRKWMWLLHGDYYKHRAFAKPLKQVVQILTDCSPKKLETHEGKESVFPNAFHSETETYRDILKHVGKHTRRYLANWIDKQWRRETQLWNESCCLPNYWILSDLRLDDELQWLKNIGQKGDEKMSVERGTKNGERGTKNGKNKTLVYIVRVESARDVHLNDSDVTEVSVDKFQKNDIDFTIYNINWDDNQRNLDNQCRLVCETILDQIKMK